MDYKVHPRLVNLPINGISIKLVQLPWLKIKSIYPGVSVSRIQKSYGLFPLSVQSEGVILAGQPDASQQQEGEEEEEEE